MFKKIKDRLVLRFARRNEFTSEYLRDFFEKHYDIHVGKYSYGCFDPARIGRNTHIGRYCSFAPTAYVFRRNHGVDFISSHPFLYNELLDFPIRKNLPYLRCDIADDVWVGHLATILPSVKSVGRGAVIAAGAVVTKDVPAYSVVAGNPARIVKMRFPQEIINVIEQSKWWEFDKKDLARFFENRRESIFEPGKLIGHFE
ncbi:MAG: CatB-related O-acetyltransferase [bacterium]|nr:CatB-related O-acetyltransferase [bacterium]